MLGVNQLSQAIEFIIENQTGDAVIVRQSSD
jgi:hypothetical protein